MNNIISIVGKTNSGKTTLIEKIIPLLKNKGYRIGTIKHDAHQFDIDHEGKDTWRMTKAGAEIVTIASKNKMGMVKKLNREYTIDEIAQQLYSDVDIIITEGYKKQDKPKIEVTSSSELLCTKNDNLKAIVINKRDGDLNKERFDKIIVDADDMKCFTMEDINEIVDFIEKELIK